MEKANVLDNIDEFLNKKQKTWVKANHRKDTVFLLKLMLDSEKK